MSRCLEIARGEHLSSPSVVVSTFNHHILSKDGYLACHVKSLEIRLSIIGTKVVVLEFCGERGVTSVLIVSEHGHVFTVVVLHGCGTEVKIISFNKVQTTFQVAFIITSIDGLDQSR